MIWLVRRLRRDFGTWDRSTRLAFLLGGVLLLAALIIALIAPPDARLPVLIGAALLLIVLEIAVLWGNRGMISTYTRAQRLYLNGDLEGARDLLEAGRANAGTPADARTLTLLGNTYRQLGQLSESEAVLSEAVDKAPERYFSFYGFGRTLLSEGRYAEAAAALRRALAVGAPPGVQVDLAEAYYRLDQPNQVAAALEAAGAAESWRNEPHRALMAAYLSHRIGASAPPSMELVRAGLPYWQAAAERFRETPYGAALSNDVSEMLRTETHG